MKDLLQVAPTAKKNPKPHNEKTQRVTRATFQSSTFKKSEKMSMPFQLTQAYHQACILKIHAKLLVVTTRLHFLKRTFHIGENFNLCLN